MGHGQEQESIVEGERKRMKTTVPIAASDESNLSTLDFGPATFRTSDVSPTTRRAM